MTHFEGRLTVTTRPDAPAAVCVHCHHPIAHHDGVGWIDETPVMLGGLYDFCTAVDGTHVPDRRPDAH